MKRLEELLQQCTVKILLPAEAGWGTGFFVAPGLVLTCTHVVRQVLDRQVELFWSAQAQRLTATVLEQDDDGKSLDVALLAIVGPCPAHPCVLLDGATVASGQALYSYGYLKSYPDAAPVRCISEGLTGDLPPLLKFQAGQVEAGLSGAALLDLSSGKVCGMVKETRDSRLGLGGSAVPAAVILAQFPNLVEQQQVFHQQDQHWQNLLPPAATDRASVISQKVSGDGNQIIGQVVVSEGGSLIIHSTSSEKTQEPSGIPSNLPRSGVVEFVGRDETMRQLHDLLQQDERVAVSAIAGMGGIGKTELALQYALSYQHSYPGGLCWLQARSGDVGTQLLRFAQSCLELEPPDGLELADQLKYCWRNWQAGEVLLVLDDVIDYKAIAPYFPPATEPRFKLLLTTRLQLGRSVQQLQLDVLDAAAALALLASLVGAERLAGQQEEAQQLCEQLGYLPLGLELAGRYLERKGDLTVAALRQRLDKQQLAARALCQTDADMTAKLGVAAAFQLSWEALSAAAQQLGCGLSLFAAAPIPWSVVEQCFVEQEPEDLEDWRDEELLNLHLLQRVSESSYRLHPLIREFFGSKLEQLPEVDEMKRQVCRVLATAAKQIPDNPTRAEITAVAPLIPHLDRVVAALPEWLEQEDLIAPYVGLGDFYQGQGLYAKAEPYLTQGLNHSREKLGEAHSDVATSLNNLAGLYDNQGRYSEAEPLYFQSLKLRQQLLGEAHPDVAISLNNLAGLYSDQGRYSEAEPLYFQSLKLYQQLFGEEHPDVAISLNNLAMLYSSQGRYSEAEPLYFQSLKLYQQLFGEEHPDVATSLNNLAGLYSDQGRYSEAEPLYLRALKLRRQLLGEVHPDVATSLNNLAELYSDQGRYSEAEPLYLRSLRLYRHFFEEEHPYIALSLNSLAMLYSDQGRYGEAEPLYLQALKLYRHFFGEEHPNVGIFLVNLGALQAAQERKQEARVSFRTALAILKRGLGAEHPRTVSCRAHLKQLEQQK